MKKFIIFISICVIAIFISSSFSAFADTDDKCSLTLKYCYNNTSISGLDVEIYRVAQLTNDNQYELVDPFKSYPININGISNQREWNEIAATLAGFAISQNLEPIARNFTDADGLVKFSSLKNGLYLTLSASFVGDDETIVFGDFLTSLPHYDKGIITNDVFALPKPVINTTVNSKLDYKIVKQWKDISNIKNRPESIEVEIYKNDSLQYTETLSSENNWTFAWEAVDDGSKWRVVERNVPSQYKVLTTDKSNTIIITNEYIKDFDDTPKTGDTTVLWPYQITLCVSGCLLILFALWRKRFE